MSRSPSTATASTSATGCTSRTTAAPSTPSCARVRPGQVYNVGGGNELSNIDLVHLLLHALAQQTGTPEEDYTRLITFVPTVRDTTGDMRWIRPERILFWDWSTRGSFERQIEHLPGVVSREAEAIRGFVGYSRMREERAC